MKRIKLANSNRYALVDDSDYNELIKFTWRLTAKGYVIHSRTFMHRLINKTPSHMQTDHINNNKLDNRKSNLRTCTHAENQRYKPDYTGITKQGGKWVARVQDRGERKYLGYFKEKEEALFVVATWLDRGKKTKDS